MHVVKDEPWVKDCRFWLYRGAWQEWDLDMVDMAVPLSPDEVIQKRHAIYRHLSQKDVMPFPGEDKREFWQRAEKRTQNTAKLYDRLGMAEYQAIEVFSSAEESGATVASRSRFLGPANLRAPFQETRLSPDSPRTLPSKTEKRNEPNKQT